MKLFDLVFVASVLVASNMAKADEVLLLSSSKSSYAAGESAVLQARSLVRPQDPKLELFFTSTFKGVGMPVQIVDGSGFSITPALTSGIHQWVVQLYLQDAKAANELSESIDFFEAQNDRIDQELQGATDPEVINNLNAEKARNLILIGQLQTELARVRTAVGTPQQLNVQVSE